ncbi:MAG: hypothetical protein R3A79_21075 [Nannocystaceae bacterium]
MSGEFRGARPVVDFVSTPLLGGHFTALLERTKTRALAPARRRRRRRRSARGCAPRSTSAAGRCAGASGGAEAIAALRDARTVVLDLMPVVDGFAVLEMIASTPALAGLPVVVTVPPVLTIAEIYLLRERVLHLLRERGGDGEALLRAAVAELRERVALENSAS